MTPSRFVFMEQVKKSPVYKSALRFLNASSKSVAELQQKLETKGFDEVEITAVLEQLNRDRYLDDDHLAQQVIDRYWAEKKMSRVRVEQELRRRLLREDLIQTTLAELDSEQEQIHLKELATKQWNLAEGKDLEKRKYKVAGFLSRYGYDFESVEECLTQLSEGSP